MRCRRCGGHRGRRLCGRSRSRLHVSAAEKLFAIALRQHLRRRLRNSYGRELFAREFRYVRVWRTLRLRSISALSRCNSDI